MRSRFGRTAAPAMAVLAFIGSTRFVARADTAIAPGDVGGQVWTASKGPYHVSGASIAVGTELRIAAGTVVRFKDGALLTVLGGLTVEGTAAAPVILEPEPGVKWGGIFVGKDPASVKVAGAIIRKSQNDGMQLQGGDAIVEKTIVEDCIYGITINVANRAGYVFDAVVLRNNSLAGMGIGNAMSSKVVTITNALIYSNNSGLIVDDQGLSQLTIVNSTIDGNSDYGIEAPGASVEIRNGIISNNRIGVEFGRASISDTTFWKNTEGHVLQRAADSAVRTVDPTVEWPGSDDVVADPRYVSATDRHLGAGSSCIDSGGVTLAPDHDLDGNGRPVEGDGVVDADGSAFDRGAYEFLPRGAGNGGAPGGGNGAAGGRGGAMGGGGAQGGNGGVGGSDGTGAPGGGGPPGGANGATGGGGGTMTIGEGGAPGAMGGGGGVGGTVAVGGAGAPGGGATGGGGGVGGTMATGAAGHGGVAGEGAAGRGGEGGGCSCAAIGEGRAPWRAVGGVALALALARRRSRPRGRA